MNQKPLPGTMKSEEMPEQTLPFGITSCNLLKCACRRGLGSWYKSWRSCCPFCMGRELALLIPLFPLALGEGKEQPKEALACSSGGWASSALREQQLWTGLREVWPTFLWILHSVGRNIFHRLGGKKSLLKSFQFLPVCSKGQIGSFSLLTV